MVTDQPAATVAEVRTVWLAVANRAPGQAERFDRMLESVRAEERERGERERAALAVAVNEQARAEAKKRYPEPRTLTRGGMVVGFEEGFLAGHEAATRTREARLEAALDAVLTLHRRDDDGDCTACGVDTYEEPIPWPCATARAVDTAMRAGSVDTHTDTPGEDTDHAE